MATLPENIGFDTTFILAAQPSLTWVIDKTINQVVGMDSGLESVRQAVEIILNVERYRWQIYSNNFGVEFHNLKVITNTFNRYVLVYKFYSLRTESCPNERTTSVCSLYRLIDLCEP